MKKTLTRNGQILNHSSKTLLVIETDSGKAVAHLLGPKRKSPGTVDADGFKRQDGKTILGHKAWWKILDYCRADIWEIGSDFLLPVSLMIPVSDNKFGKYEIVPGEWGEEMVYVKARILNKRRKVVGYKVEKYGRLSKSEAIRLAAEGKLDNVVVAGNVHGTAFLRTKKNASTMDNLTA